jgi:type I site-specific restriction endonuclease
MALCSTGGAWTLAGPAVSMTSKKDLSERDICRIYITPAITGGGWDGQTQIREQVYLTAGRVIVRGKLAKRSEKRKFADYVLYRGDTPIAIVEAKDNTQVVGAGMQQALEYAEMVDVPCVDSGFTTQDCQFVSSFQQIAVACVNQQCMTYAGDAGAE